MGRRRIKKSLKLDCVVFVKFRRDERRKINQLRRTTKRSVSAIVREAFLRRHFPKRAA